MPFIATASEYNTANEPRERAALGVAYMHSVSWQEASITVHNQFESFRSSPRGLVIRKLRVGAMPLRRQSSAADRAVASA